MIMEDLERYVKRVWISGGAPCSFCPQRMAYRSIECTDGKIYSYGYCVEHKQYAELDKDVLERMKVK